MVLNKKNVFIIIIIIFKKIKNIIKYKFFKFIINIILQILIFNLKNKIVFLTLIKKKNQI
ncbi:hypothetical protein B0A77_02740 [Flavobacterium branchiophilum]|uniref:Uncharacterized protein n=1 Tax=Flavobacterium branchiophilum TaxID=55197 RepID=A0A2H3KY10_9FLAO|nr:hypothetical protein B0A77_02740 [Flavobacterium branchiophilum]